MKTTACAFLLVLLLPALPAGAKAPLKTAPAAKPAKAAGVPAWLNGAWAGTGYQTDSGSTWDIRATVDAANGRYFVTYPSLECGGRWDLVRVKDGAVWFTERITEGVGNCVDGVTIVVTRIDERFVTYTVFLKDGTLNAWSTLSRGYVGRGQYPGPEKP